MVSGVVLEGALVAMSFVLSCCWTGAGADGSDTAAHRVPPAVSSKAAEMASSFFMGSWFVYGRGSCNDAAHPESSPADEHISDARDVDLNASVAVMTVSMAVSVMVMMVVAVMPMTVVMMTVSTMAVSVAPVTVTMAMIMIMITRGRRGGNECQGRSRDKGSEQKFHRGFWWFSSAAFR